MFRYQKDGSSNKGLDGAFIDNLSFKPEMINSDPIANNDS